LLFFCMAFFLVSAGVYASYDAGLPGSFLFLAPEARGAALGNGFAAVSRGASSIYYNPAHLTKGKKPELNLSMTWLFEDTSHSFFAFSYPLSSFALGAGYIRETSGNFERRLNPFESLGSFSVSNEAFLLGGALRTGIPGFKEAGLGFSLKAVKTRVDSASGSGWGMDAGSALEVSRGTFFSAVFRNVKKPSLSIGGEKTEYLSSAVFSFSKKFYVWRDVVFLPLVAAVKRESQDLKLSGGGELGYKRNFKIRFSADSSRFNTGFGVDMGNYSFDYAAFFHEIAPVHTLSLSVRFGVTMEDLEAYIKKGMKKFNKEEASRLARAYVQQANIYHRNKEYAKAVKTLETASLWQPDNKKILRKLADFRKTMDENLNKRMIERTRLLALDYYEKGDYLLSVQYWQSVLEIDKENQEAKKYVAKLEKLLAKGRKLATKKIARKRKAEKHSLYLNAALKSLEKGNYAYAIKNLRRALSILPSSEKAKLLLSNAEKELKLSINKRLAQADKFYREKKYTKAIAIYESVLKDSPQNVPAKKKIKMCRSFLKPKLSASELRRAEQLYYMAVDAYLKNNFSLSQKYIGEILAVDPFNEAAEKLKGKIKNALR